MKLIISPHKIEIDKTPVNEKEIKVTKVEFEFADEITNDYVKEAYFTLNGTSYKEIIVNNQCNIPYEVLTQQGQVEIGVVAYLVENEEEIKRYNPSPVFIATWVGSLKDEAENSEPITPSEMEQYEQALQDGLSEVNEKLTEIDNLDIDAEKVGTITTVTITKKDGTEKSVEILDGEKGEKGDKGDAGAIKMIIVQELPATGQEDTIYLVPLEEPESQENRYAEYVYINNAWELLGKIGIQVDLTDYYTKEETNTLLSGKQNALTFDNTPTQSSTNPVTSGGIYTYITGIVGDINTALDTINGEVI